MPFLLPQLNVVESGYDGTKPLPHRLERVARLLAAAELTQHAIAKRCNTSVPSIWRLKQQPAFMARLAHLSQLAAERAERAAPLGYKGNRVALVDEEVRALREQLHANNYRTVLGVSKQGNPIEGFDSARVAAMLRGVALIDSMVTPKQSTIVEATTNNLNVTMTTADAVTRVQALLSRTEQPPGTPMGTPDGGGGGYLGNGYDGKDASGSPQGIDNILDAKAEG